MPKHNHSANGFVYNSLDNPFTINPNGNSRLSTATGKVGVDYIGGNQAHNNMPPYIVQNFIIKAYNNARTLSIVENSLDSDSTKNAASVHSVNRALSNLSKFSSNVEIKTGEKWINNKPIYRKVIYEQNTSGETINIDISSLNVDHILIDLSHSFGKWTSHKRILPLLSTNIEASTATSNVVAQNQIGTYYNYSTKTLVVEVGYARKLTEIYITIEYTKTTDILSYDDCKELALNYLGYTKEDVPSQVYASYEGEDDNGYRICIRRSSDTYAIEFLYVNKNTGVVSTYN